jgi:uncharacterized membrane protein YqaE (UPF0057 family)
MRASTTTPIIIIIRTILQLPTISVTLHRGVGDIQSAATLLGIILTIHTLQ